MRSPKSALLALYAMLMATVKLVLDAARMAWNDSQEHARAMLRNFGEGGRRFADADHAMSGLNTLGVLIIGALAAIIVPIVMISVLALLLPDYFASLTTIFDAFSSVNTTNWPPIVATVFAFAPLVIGIVAITGLFALGAIVAIGKIRGAK